MLGQRRSFLTGAALLVGELTAADAAMSLKIAMTVRVHLAPLLINTAPSDSEGSAILQCRCYVVLWHSKVPPQHGVRRAAHGDGAGAAGPEGAAARAAPPDDGQHGGGASLLLTPVHVFCQLLSYDGGYHAQLPRCSPRWRFAALALARGCALGPPARLWCSLRQHDRALPAQRAKRWRPVACRHGCCVVVCCHDVR